MTFQITVEGIYESDIGSGQKKFTPFKFDFKVARFKKEGIETHILRRFIPLLVKDLKNKPIFSKVKSFCVTELKQIDDNFVLEGKDINKLNEWEIQELATMYDLYDIPLPSSMSIVELREKAILAYMKNVLKIPMSTPKEKEALAFFEKMEDGTYKLNLGDEQVTVQVDKSFYGEQAEVVEKKSLSDFFKSAGQTVANGILAMTGNQVGDGQQQPPQQGQFPTAEQLAGQTT